MNRILMPEDVLSLRFVRDGQISPCGKSIAYALSHTDRTAASDVVEIRVRDVSSGTERLISDCGKVNYPRWSNDGRRLAYVRVQRGNNALVIVNLDDESQRSISAHPSTISGAPAWSPDGRKIALVISDPRSASLAVRRITSRTFRAEGMGFIDGNAQRLCVVDIAQGTFLDVVGKPAFYSNLDWDVAGESILFLSTTSPIPYAGESARLCSVRVSDRYVREILGDDWYVAAARWIPGTPRVLVIGAYQSRLTVPTTDLWVVNVDGSERALRSTAVKGRVGYRMHHDMPIWDISQLNAVSVNTADSALVTVQEGGRAGLYEIALSGPERCERVVGGDRSCILLNSCRNGSKVLYLVTDMLSPPDLHVWSRSHETTQITQVNHDVLSDWPSLYIQQLTFRSADGLELEGWFLSDAARTAPVPTVMFIHGGPFNAIGHAFRFDFHLLASRGMGVVFANFRGSFGYGEEFAVAIMGDWGARGFPDHMAAVDRAVELGLADANRLGVWGHSHGGFATCWMVGHTARFRAAVAEAAVTNMVSAYYLSDAPNARERDLGGKPHEIPDVYRSRSPLTYAHRCTTPTLLIHGEQDLRCPIVEAEQFHRALLDAGCVAEIVRLRDANHLGDSVGPPETRVAQNAALSEWFERFL